MRASRARPCSSSASCECSIVAITFGATALITGRLPPTTMGSRGRQKGSRCRLNRSEPARLLDDVEQRLPGDESPEVVEKHLVAAPGNVLAIAGDVRGDYDVLHRPERVVRRKRLDLEHVEPGSGDLPRAERRYQRVELDDLPAADVDEVGGRPHGAESRRVEHAARLRG